MAHPSCARKGTSSKAALSPFGKDFSPFQLPGSTGLGIPAVTAEDARGQDVCKQDMHCGLSIATKHGPCASLRLLILSRLCKEQGASR